jgi:hypothetical protein
VGDPSPFTLGRLRASFSVLDKHTGDVLSTRAQSVSLPLLGTGSQGLEIQEVIPEALKLVRKWPHKFPMLQVVRIVADDLEKVALPTRTIDEVMHARTEDSGSALIRALGDELAEKLPRLAQPELRQDLSELLQIASAPGLSVKSIATMGTRLAEVCARLLRHKYHTDLAVPRDLQSLLKGISEEVTKTQRWLIQYFRLLQRCGNVSARPGPLSVTMLDAAAVPVCVLRVAEFTESELSSAAGPD